MASRKSATTSTAVQPAATGRRLSVLEGGMSTGARTKTFFVASAAFSAVAGFGDGASCDAAGLEKGAQAVGGDLESSDLPRRRFTIPATTTTMVNAAVTASQLL